MTLFTTRAFQATAAALALAGSMLAGSLPALAEGDAPVIARQDWTFGGLTGYFDKPQLRRGYQVYKNVCANCHSMRLMYFRNLSQPGGPEFSETNVDQFASEAKVTELDDNGDTVERPGKSTDRFPAPFANPQAAAAANGGATPPDLSIIAKARGVERAAAWYVEPFNWLSDLATSYQEQGPDYLHALMTGYKEPPKDVKMYEGMSYNVAFPGHQIRMPPPLSDGLVSYDDGTPATVDNYARDVSAFLAWSAEPKLEERKRMGLKVLIYLAILSALLYLSKRTLWRNVEH